MSNVALPADLLRSHWALQAVGEEDLRLAEQLVERNLAAQSAGHHVGDEYSPDDDADSLLERVLLAYELTVIGSIADFRLGGVEAETARERVTGSASRAFDIIRLRPVPQDETDRILHVLHLSALACCGERWEDLRSWYRSHEAEIGVSDDAVAPWDQIMLNGMYRCWVRLFRKDSGDDLDSIRETIAGLRDDQRQMEDRIFEDGGHASNRALPFRLTALDHWAKATEILSLYMLNDPPSNSLGLIDKHFDASIQASTRARDPQLEIILRWARAASFMMLVKS